MNWLGLLILGVLGVGAMSSFHPRGRRLYRHHYRRARSYASYHYNRYRRRYY